MTHLERNEIPWDHWIAFGVDNTNSNIGAKNSIKSSRKLNTDLAAPSVCAFVKPVEVINAALFYVNSRQISKGFSSFLCCIVNAMTRTPNKIRI